MLVCHPAPFVIFSLCDDKEAIYRGACHSECKITAQEELMWYDRPAAIWEGRGLDFNGHLGMMTDGGVGGYKYTQ